MSTAKICKDKTNREKHEKEKISIYYNYEDKPTYSVDRQMLYVP